MKKFFDSVNLKLKKSLIKAGNVLGKNDGFGRDEILGTAAVLIIAAFITIPQLRTFVSTIVAALNSWWSNTISGRIFPSS